jgi:predicted nucleic acid-binding protein
VTLVDTSVWVRHLRAGDERLAAQLEVAEVLMHRFVISELACGSLPNRHETLRLFRLLPMALTASDDEATELVERRSLMGRGIGFIDVHLLAGALLSGAQLWTLDRRLATVAAELGIGYSEA